MLSQEVAGIGQRPRKIDGQYWPDAFNTKGEPRSEIL